MTTTGSAASPTTDHTTDSPAHAPSDADTSPATSIATAHQSLATFLDNLAAPRPDPGGGAASAVVLAIGTALAQMVTGYSDELRRIEPGLEARLQTLRDEAVEMIDADAAASAAFAAAARIPAGSPRRAGAVVDACLHAADSALAIAAAATRLVTDLRLLDRLGEPRVRADVRVAAAAVGTAIRASNANAQACVALAQETGATAGDLLHVIRRLADLREPLEVADALASR